MITSSPPLARKCDMGWFLFNSGQPCCTTTHHQSNISSSNGSNTSNTSNTSTGTSSSSSRANRKGSRRDTYRATGMFNILFLFYYTNLYFRSTQCRNGDGSNSSMGSRQLIVDWFTADCKTVGTFANSLKCAFICTNNRFW